LRPSAKQRRVVRREAYSPRRGAVHRNRQLKSPRATAAVQ
jgi:hypothetical protein